MTIAQLKSFIASRLFFYISLAWLVVGSIWMALISAYPMAFDEEWHVGLIKIYASHWLPFGIEKTPDMAHLGSATSDPSFFYHYLMSFPWRLLEMVGVSESGRIIVLRFVSIALMVTAFFLFKKILLRTGASRFTAHIILALFSLIPIMPLLASEVNYDNLFFVFVALTTLFTVEIGQAIRRKKPIPARTFWLLIIVVLFGAVTKYSFLPIALACVLYLGFLAIYYRVSLPRLWQDTVRLGAVTLIILGVGLAAGFGMQVRNVNNIAQHGTVNPSCDTFFEEKLCMDYGPWGRDKKLSAALSGDFQPMSFPEYFVTEWIPGVTQRIFFTLSGPGNSYDTKSPLVVPLATFVAIAAVGTVLFLIRIKKILARQPSLWFFGLAFGGFVAALTLQTYDDYVYTGHAVALNGRYLLPFLPLVGLMFAAGFREQFRSKKARNGLVVTAAVLIVLIALQGGGAMTYLVLAEHSWLWSNPLQVITESVQPILRPLLPQF